MTNEQLVIRIKAGEDVAGNMEQLYSQVRRFPCPGLEVPGQLGTGGPGAGGISCPVSCH